mmetsp:Transcript_87790/g.226283  ORF Transcript_87790/g.226283 Transcript_87790/m.226283 type:complete len:401 (-) Transcript_87790:38-1240(-)
MCGAQQDFLHRRVKKTSAEDDAVVVLVVLKDDGQMVFNQEAFIDTVHLERVDEPMGWPLPCAPTTAFRNLAVHEEPEEGWQRLRSPRVAVHFQNLLHVRSGVVGIQLEPSRDQLVDLRGLPLKGDHAERARHRLVVSQPTVIPVKDRDPEVALLHGDVVEKAAPPLQVDLEPLGLVRLVLVQALLVRDLLDSVLQVLFKLLHRLIFIQVLLQHSAPLLRSALLGVRQLSPLQMLVQRHASILHVPVDNRHVEVGVDVGNGIINGEELGAVLDRLRWVGHEDGGDPEHAQRLPGDARHAEDAVLPVLLLVKRLVRVLVRVLVGVLLRRRRSSSNRRLRSSSSKLVGRPELEQHCVLGLPHATGAPAVLGQGSTGSADEAAKEEGPCCAPHRETAALGLVCN